ncbi:MAG: hypothetical protein ACE5IQ_00430 [Candidatus Methylomirabilales bacterium]
MRVKGTVCVVLVGLIGSACAASKSPPGRVGDLRGRIVQIEREQGLIVVAAKPDAEEYWLKIAAFTSVRGPAISTVDALQTGQRVYVRYLREPRTDPPEVLSITVIEYTLGPSGGGPGSFAVPGF